MQLLLLVVGAGVLGYLLARSRAAERVDDFARQAGDRAQQFTARSSEWVDDQLDRVRGSSRKFHTWALEEGSMPADFQRWFRGLSSAEADNFVRGLENHTRNFGLNLNKLVAGDLDKNTDLRSIYVEAVSVYSQAYRKAKEARKNEEPKVEAVEGEVVGEKTMAEKSTSRRKHNGSPAGEAPQAA